METTEHKKHVTYGTYSFTFLATGNSVKMQSQHQQGRRTRTPSLGGASSLYSYASTTRTMSRSMKSLRVAWYKRPLVQDAFVTDIQTGALITAIFSLVCQLT